MKNIVMKPSSGTASAKNQQKCATTINYGTELLSRKSFTKITKKMSGGVGISLPLPSGVVGLDKTMSSPPLSSTKEPSNKLTAAVTTAEVPNDQREVAADNDRNKKKRCSDRYDSSESSDSGVATTLSSCTDSSTTSSDASDPGSPYSPLSLTDDGQQQQITITKVNMPPQTLSDAAQKQKQPAPAVRKPTTQWPWSADISITPAKTAASNLLHISAVSNKNKRNSVDACVGTTSVKKTRTVDADTKQILECTQGTTITATAIGRKLKASGVVEESQTKITGYFKSQMKPLNGIVKKDPVVAPNLQKFVSPSNSGNCLASNLKSLKKMERSKPTKIAQVAPNLRKTTSNVSASVKSPKKHVAIAPRTAEMKATTPAPVQTSPAPTVLLTAIHIPNTEQNLTQMPQKLQTQVTNNPTSIYQIPVMPNLVQIPNLLAATTANRTTNLVVNNSGQLTGMTTQNAAQYFLNGTVFKFQSFPTTPTTAIDTTCLSNILMKTQCAVSLQTTMTTTTAPLQPNKLQQGAMTPTYNSPPQSQRLAARPVFIPSLLLPTMLAATTPTKQQQIPALQPIQSTSSQMPPLQPTTQYVVSGIAPPPLAVASTAFNKHHPHTHTVSSTQPPPLVTISSNSPSTSIPNTSPGVGRVAAIARQHAAIKKSPTSKTSPVKVEKENSSVTNAVDLFDLIKNSQPEKAIVVSKVAQTISTPPSSPKSTVLEEIKLKTPPTSNPNYADTDDAEATTSSTRSMSELSIDTKDMDTDTSPANDDDTTKPDSLPSPILSQPKTIRFPAAGGSGCHNLKGAKRHDGVCYWNNCNMKHDSSSKLLDHLQTDHVNTQTGPFCCFWIGCKVIGQESCSRRWLERHVLSHGGTKPFKCIVDGCKLRFGSQLALQKHVNGHFNSVDSKESTSKRTSDPPVPKVLKKNGKKLRYRRQPFSARRFDFIDAGTVEGIHHRMRMMSTVTNDSNEITFVGQSSLRRSTADGNVEYLVKWKPSQIIPDEWLPASSKPYTKTVNIRSMKANEKINVESLLTSTYRPPVKAIADCTSSSDIPAVKFGASKRKQSRKPPKSTQPPS